MDIHQAQKWARTGERQNINAIANGTVISKGRNRLKTPFCTARLGTEDDGVFGKMTLIGEQVLNSLATRYQVKISLEVLS